LDKIPVLIKGAGCIAQQAEAGGNAFLKTMCICATIFLTFTEKVKLISLEETGIFALPDVLNTAI
jgi:hypothetical protein